MMLTGRLARAATEAAALPAVWLTESAIADLIDAALNGAITVLNVGAAAGGEDAAAISLRGVSL